MTGFSLDMSYTRFVFRSTSRAGSEGRSKIAMNSLIGSVGCASSVSVYAYLRTGLHSAFHTLLQRRKRQQGEQASPLPLFGENEKHRLFPLRTRCFTETKLMTGFSLDMSYTRFVFRSTSRAGSEGRSKIAMNSLIGSVGCASSVSVYAYLRTGLHSAFHTLLQRRKRQQREQAFVCSFCMEEQRNREYECFVVFCNGGVYRD